MDNVWDLNVRKGWVVGLALAVLSIAATVGLTILAIVTPLSIWVFLQGVGACLTLGFTVRVLYQLWGLVNASYELDRNALVIHWGAVEHQIPLASVREVFSGAKLKGLRIRLSLRWPGYCVALGRTIVPESDAAADEHRPLDPILFYATAHPKDQIMLRTQSVTYAISPADTEAFLTALGERMEMGPTQDVEERSTHPAFLDWEIWQDRWALGMLLGSLALVVLLIALLSWRYPHLPARVALRFTPTGEPLLVASAARIFYFAVLGAAFAVIDGGLGIFFYHRERPLAYFLWSGLLATLGSLWAAVVSILLMQ